MAQPPPNSKSTVHRLYEVADSSNVVIEQRQTSESNPIPMSSIGNLLKTITKTPQEDMFKPNYGRSFSYHGTSTWVGIGGCIQGSSFTLRVRNQHNTQTNGQSVRVREVDPTPCMRESDSSLFQEIQHSDVNPTFEIEIERSVETTCNSNGLNMQLTFSTEVDQNANYLILQQEAGSTQWQNITETCTTTQGSGNIEIPVKKSSKIWVIRLKKSLGSLKHALLALIHGQVLFHILVYYRYLKKNGKAKVRIIGISEELYQNPKRLKTPVTVAEEDKFQKSPEIAPKLLLKKGHLNLEVQKNGEHASSRQFDIGRNKSCDWHDCSFYTNELKENLEVKVTDKDGIVQWSIDLNEILCDDSEPVEQPVDISKPEIASFNDEVCDRHIPWLARHLNKDVEKVARLLKVDSYEIDAIKQGELVETRNIRILEFWRKATLCRGNGPTWNQIKAVLESENVGRFDVIRSLLNEEEIGNDVFLWLEQRVASSCGNYARVLGVPDHEVSIIRDSFHGCEERCTAVLKRWRQRTPNPKVEDLIEALEHDAMKKNELAKEMRQRFCEEG